jgi:uncharacterized protein (TIRG00374 family)
MNSLFKRHDNLFAWLRVVFTSVLFFFAALFVDIRVVIESVANLRWWFVPSGLLLFVLGAILSTMRWRLFLHDKPFVVLFRSHIISVFYSFLLPSFLPADASRVISAKSSGDSTARIAATVMVDRVVGIVTFLVFSTIVVLIDEGVVGENERIILCACSIGSSITILLNYHIGVQQFVLKATAKFKRAAPIVGTQIESMYCHGVMVLRGLARWSEVLRLLILSTLIHLFSTCTFVLIGLATNYTISLQHAVILATVGQFMSLLPLSFAGVGLREVSLVALMESFGIPREVSTGALLAGYSNTLIVVFVGWIMTLTNRSNVR